MIYSLSGELIKKDKKFIVIECSGVGYKVFVNETVLKKLPEKNNKIFVFCFMYIRDEQMEIYGFLEEESLKLFEFLKTVSGVGPKTAMGVLDIDSTPNIAAAIIEKRVDLISRATGIGKKTAERIILELHNKIKTSGNMGGTKTADQDHDIEEVLVDLGYQRYRARSVIQSIPHNDTDTIEERIKLVLKELGK